MTGLPAESVLFSWAFEPVPVLGLAVAAIFYLLGWRKLNVQIPRRFPVERLISFLAGLAVIFVALASPLDAFASWLLIDHMAQHLLLTMVAPPLLLLGWPMLPLLSGLPRGFARGALAPFLNSPFLKRIGRFLVHPFFAGPLFIFSNVFWHVPALYELALGSPGWHQFEHLCFLGTALLFWWPVIQPWPSRPALPRWVMIPYLLLADLQNTALAAFLSFQGGVIYPTYAAAPRISGLSAIDDQAAAGALMWVPGSIVFLLPVAVIAISFLNPRRSRNFEPEIRKPKPARRMEKFDLLRIPLFGKWMRGKYLRRVLQTLMAVIALTVVLDGLLGPQVSVVNLAGVMPWLHWSAISAIGFLAVGNLFCMVCPFTLARDLGRKIFPSTREWPRALRSKWFAVALLAGFFWAYEMLNLWDSPWWTAWIIIFYFSGAVLVDGFFKNASFCKYVCPIGQFNFVASLVSPMEVRIREADVCSSCKTHDCIKGNDQQRGCELQLFQPRKSSNMDCTFCLDCVKACPHDNVGILVVAPGSDLIAAARRSSVGRFADRPDLAALVLVFVFAAFANVAAMISPVREMQEAVHRMAGPLGAGAVWCTVFIFCVVILPFALTGICGWLSSLSTDEKPSVIARGFSPALVPLGFAMWAAHVSFHVFSGVLTPWPIVMRMARDLGLATATPPWNVSLPVFAGLPGLQILLLNAGLLFSLWILWRKSLARGGRPLRIFLPWGILASALYLAGIWLIFQQIDIPVVPS